MAKRQREDYESPSTDPASPVDSSTPDSPVIHPSHVQDPSVSSKIAHLDPGSGEAPPPPAMQCSLPPHKQTLSFETYEEYEVHYNKSHVNRCMECRRNFPTEHFLNLHILENHDALVSVKKERGDKTYSCFVEDCDKVCSAPEKRRMHLIDKHMFPKDYDFFVVNDGIDRRSSMLRSGRHRRRSSAAHGTTNAEDRARRRNSIRQNVASKEKSVDEIETESREEIKIMMPPSSQEGVDVDMEGLSGAMSALKFVPASVRFGGRGRGRGRGGFSRT